MRILIGILMGVAIATVALAMLRSLGARRPDDRGSDVVEVPAPDVRITFWCENCGTEVLLLRFGSDASPRHCGEKMIRREELAHN